MRITNSVGQLATTLLILSLTAGCSSSGRMEEGEKAVEGFAKLKAGLAKAQTQVDEVIKSMDQLQAGGDLQKSYSTFNSEVSDLQKTAAAAKKRADAMRKNVDAYVQKWQKEMETLSDPTIKASLGQRREAVRANFTRVSDSAHAVRGAYDPFVAHLQEIQKALSIDLTPANVAGIKPSIDKARADGQTLKQRIAALQAELDRIQAGLSPTGAAPAKS